MNAPSQPRTFARFWRVGLAIVVVAVLAVGGLIAVGNRGGPSRADGDATSAGTNSPSIAVATSATLYAPAAAAATTAPARTGNSAPAPAVAASGRAVARSQSGTRARRYVDSGAPAAISERPADHPTATIQFTAKDVVGTQTRSGTLPPN